MERITQYRVLNKVRVVTVLAFLMGLIGVWFFLQAYDCTIGFNWNRADMEQLTKVEKTAIYHRMQEIELNIDSYIASTFMFTQLSISLLVATLSYIFMEEHEGFFNFKSIRQKTQFRYGVLKDLLIHSFLNAATLYAVYLLFLWIGALVSGNSPSTDRTLLNSFFGEGFYSKHPYIYYTIESFLRMFVFTFVYTLFTCSSYLLTKKKHLAFIIPVGYYFVVTIIMGALLGIQEVTPAYTQGISSFDNGTIAGAMMPLILPLLITGTFLLIVFKRGERVA